MASQGFAVQLPCTHPPLLHNIPGKKIPGYNPRQPGCKMGAIFWSDDPVSVSGLLSPCTIENIKDSPNHCPSLAVLTLVLSWGFLGGPADPINVPESLHTPCHVTAVPSTKRLESISLPPDIGFDHVIAFTGRMKCKGQYRPSPSLQGPCMFALFYLCIAMRSIFSG